MVVAQDADESLLDDVSQSELVSLIKSAAEAVEQFDRVESPTAAAAAASSDVTQDKAADVAAQNLLNEAVTDVLDARRRKLSAEHAAAAAETLDAAADTADVIGGTSPAHRDDERATVAPSAPTSAAAATEFSQDDDSLFQDVSIALPSNDDVTVRSIDDLPPRPESPDIPDKVSISTVNCCLAFSFV